MVKVEASCRYAKSHEWVRPEGALVRVGVSDYAQDSLSDIVYVELPAPGAKFDREETLGVVESVKSASDVYCPIAGVVEKVNDKLLTSPETINADPYSEGWLVVLKPSDPKQLDDLMDSGAYEAFLETLQH